MANTYTLISSYTVPTTTTSVVAAFTAIPQTYTDLRVLTTLKVTEMGGWYDAFVYFNGDSTGVSQYLYGAGNGVGNGTDGSNITIRTTASSGTAANIYGNQDYYIPNYTISGRYKTIQMDQAAENASTTGSSAIQMFSNGYSTTVTAPITSISFKAVLAASTVAGSKFWLYGIKNS